MIRLRDEWGWTAAAMVLFAVAILALIVAAIVVPLWLTTPRDAQGHPLPCVHSHEETTVIMAGKVPVVDTFEVCDRYGNR